MASEDQGDGALSQTNTNLDDLHHEPAAKSEEEEDAQSENSSEEDEDASYYQALLPAESHLPTSDVILDRMKRTWGQTVFRLTEKRLAVMFKGSELAAMLQQNPGSVGASHSLPLSTNTLDLMVKRLYRDGSFLKLEVVKPCTVPANSLFQFLGEGFASRLAHHMTAEVAVIDKLATEKFRAAKRLAKEDGSPFDS